VPDTRGRGPGPAAPSSGEELGSWAGVAEPGRGEGCHYVPGFWRPARCGRVGTAGEPWSSPSHCVPCPPGHMLLSRGPWGLQLPSNMEDSVLRFPRTVPTLYVSPIKSFNPCDTAVHCLCTSCCLAADGTPLGQRFADLSATASPSLWGNWSSRRAWGYRTGQLVSCHQAGRASHLVSVSTCDGWGCGGLVLWA
jgi:hypothetical protein